MYLTIKTLGFLSPERVILHYFIGGKYTETYPAFLGYVEIFENAIQNGIQKFQYENQDFDLSLQGALALEKAMGLSREKSTGKGTLTGTKDMGSCQCGDVKWWVEYDCEALVFNFGNSNWQNGSDYDIPYVGNALEKIKFATNINEGWRYDPYYFNEAK